MNRIVLGLLLALTLVRIQAQSVDKTEALKNFIRGTECLEKENLTMDEVLTFAIEKKFEMAETVPKLKCFNACIVEHSGFMNNCAVNEEKLANIPALAKIQDALVTCKSSVNADERCECAYQLTKCMSEKLLDGFGGM